MPDVEIKEQRYKDERPKEYFDRFHARVRAGEPEAKVYESVRVVTVLHALITFRARAIGSERVPGGPLILAPNHASFMDHFFAGAFVRRRIQFMAKSQLFGKGDRQLHLQPRRRVPGPARPRRRGGVHQRLQDPRARRRDRHVLRGRPLAQRPARRRGAARDRAPGPRVGRAGRAGGDPGLPPGPQLEAAAVPPRDRELRRARSGSRSSSTPRASSSRRRPTTSSTASASCTENFSDSVAAAR